MGLQSSCVMFLNHSSCLSEEMLNEGLISTPFLVTVQIWISSVAFLPRYDITRMPFSVTWRVSASQPQRGRASRQAASEPSCRERQGQWSRNCLQSLCRTNRPCPRRFLDCQHGHLQQSSRSTNDPSSCVAANWVWRGNWTTKILKTKTLTLLKKLFFVEVLFLHGVCLSWRSKTLLALKTV